MGILYSIKIHKPIYLQSNSVHLRPTLNIVNLSSNNITSKLMNQVNNDVIISAFINRTFNIRNNETVAPVMSILSTKKSYRLVLLFIPHTKTLLDYEELCISLISYDQIVVVCKFDKDISEIACISKLDIDKLLNSIKDRVMRDIMIIDRLDVTFDALMIIGHQDVCKLINRHISLNKNIQAILIYLDPPSFEVDDIYDDNDNNVNIMNNMYNVRIVYSDKILQADKKLHNKMYDKLYRSLPMSDLELMYMSSQAYDKITNIIMNTI